MELKVFCSVEAGKMITLDVNTGDSIYIVKAKIQDKEGYPTDQQRLFFDGNELENECTLDDYHIREQHCLIMILPP